jgi:hypothetical protein
MKIKDVEAGRDYQYARGSDLRYAERVRVFAVGVHGKVWDNFHTRQSDKANYVRVEFLTATGEQTERRRTDTIIARQLVRVWDEAFDEERRVEAAREKEHAERKARNRAEAQRVKELIEPKLPEGVRLLDAHGVDGLTLVVNPEALDWLLSMFGLYHGANPGGEEL